MISKLIRFARASSHVSDLNDDSYKISSLIFSENNNKK